MQHPRRIQCLIVVMSTLYLYVMSDKGWIPHDEGLLGQSAERVQQGQMPHIDFDDAYTGGQAYLHSLTFRILGVNLYSLRLVLLAFSVLFVAVFHSLVQRLMPAWCAALITILAVVWSTPNYFAALPSWYNLYFAVYGIWALVRYDETNKLRWVFLAGVLGGFSFLFKLAGLYFIAASILFLVFHEQETANREPGHAGPRWFFAFTAICLGLFSTVLIMTVRNRLTSMDFLHFVWPGMILSLYLVANESHREAGESRVRFTELVKRNMVLFVGAMLPITIFLVPYLREGGLTAWWEGVFVLPQKRIQWADYPLPSLVTVVAVVPLAVLLFVPIFSRRLWDNVILVALCGLFSIAIVLAASQEAVYARLWYSTRPLVPLLTAVGCVMLLKQGTVEPHRRKVLFLSLATMSMVSLVQFPYSYGIYFCYVAPLVVLAYSAIVASQQFAPKRVHHCVFALYFGFAILWLNQGNVRTIGVRFVARGQETPIDVIDRFRLRISETEATLYREVVREVQRHSAKGDFIYATSDCPEIYFLSGRNNPGRTFYDFFEPDFVMDSFGRAKRIARMLEENRVNVIVFHWEGEFSGTPTTEFTEQLMPMFPNLKHFVRDPRNKPNAAPVFSVAWR
jgi:hypothetical protein